MRLTSNARTSTFKLHARPFDEQSSRLLDPFQMFVATCRRNLENLRKQKSLLSEKGFLDRGVYSGSVETMIADTSAPNDATVRQCDLLITSPPYGDNVSTIPYGQHSYLPLQWIDLTDIDRNVDPNFLRSTHEIDHRSLGGSRAIENIDVERLTELSSSYRRVSRLLASEPRDRLARVTAFCRDLEKSLTSILSNLRPGALMIWTVGNRRVANHPIPLDKMLQEFLTARGSTAVCTIARRIPTKRTALRNNIATTMRRETVVVMRNST